MKDRIRSLLKTHWGHDNFRPFQEEIILSAIGGKDTLALLPTGGGKSVCFQIPVLAQDGIGIVISPLIALMNDQVQNLKNLGIKAVALTSGRTFREIDFELDNCVNGHYKFLYISTERLQTEIVRERIKKMKINLLAVDEAHCISQWGHDFRPPYSQIAEAREWMPAVPILALTATATPKVVDDIQEKLAFREKHIIRRSFFRPNLFYNVNHTQKKWSKTLEILQKISGSALIYVRNRRHTVEISKWLKTNRISAEFYHAGISTDERKKRQKLWLENQTRVMVCTNAFGMGIDKSNVRLVLHLELPESLEAYFQEAGRAGRDGQKAWSVMLIGPSEIPNFKERQLEHFPDIKFIKKVYQSLANHFQLAASTGEGQSFAFEFQEFCKKYSLSFQKTFQSLKIMEKEGLLKMSEGFRQSSRVRILANRTSLYDYQLRHPKMDTFLKVLLRSYGGLENEYGKIQEKTLANRLGISEKEVIKTLLQLRKQNILDYIPSRGAEEISFEKARVPIEYLSISDENLKDRLKERLARVSSVEKFAENDKICRSIQLLDYFGEKSKKKCGFCDVCRSKELNKNRDTKIKEAIFKIEQYFEMNESADLQNLRQELNIREEFFVEALRWLMDINTLEINLDTIQKRK